MNCTHYTLSVEAYHLLEPVATALLFELQFRLKADSTSYHSGNWNLEPSVRAGEWLPDLCQAQDVKLAFYAIPIRWLKDPGCMPMARCLVLAAAERVIVVDWGSPWTYSCCHYSCMHKVNGPTRLCCFLTHEQAMKHYEGSARPAPLSINPIPPDNPNDDDSWSATSNDCKEIT